MAFLRLQLGICKDFHHDGLLLGALRGYGVAAIAICDRVRRERK